MTLLVVLDHRFLTTPDGSVWTRGPFGYSLWSRYLDVYDHLWIAARVEEVADPGEQRIRADGRGVSFMSVPSYVGPWQYLQRAKGVQAGLTAALRRPQSVLLRAPSHLATCAERVLRRAGRPFGVFVTGDPYDALAPGATRHPLRGLFRRWFRLALRRQCRAACSAAYVTERFLQSRYPPPPGHLPATFSDVELAPEAFAPQSRVLQPRKAFGVVWVGGMDHLYKAPDVLLAAAARCRKTGLDLELTLVGGGRYQSGLEAQARGLGLARHVRFRGQLARPAEIRAELDRADLFVLPSRQEGLPPRPSGGHGSGPARHRIEGGGAFPNC